MRPLYLLALMLSIGNAGADTLGGKKLHDSHCMRCHDTGVYTREDRFIKSLDALRLQVGRCALNSDAKWSDEDRRAVVDYLNQSFYHFE